MAGIKRRLGSLRGPQGRSPQINVGTTSQVGPESPAAVNIRSLGNARFRADFAIPEGRQGLPGVNAIPADEAVATYLSSESKTHNAINNVITSRVGGLGPSKLYGAEIAPRGPVRAFEMVDGILWGAGGGNLHTSADGGVTWTSRGAAPSGTPTRIGLTSDGGAILLTESAIYKTADISDTPVWERKATTNGRSQFLAWSLAGDGGDRWLTTEYAAGSGFPDSRYARMTQDGGNTWEIIYDSVAMHGQHAADGSHLHGCAYDPWADRWIISEGHSNNADIAGLYISEDDGATWERADGMKQSPAPTVIVATDDGLVCASDNGQGGIYGVVRTAISRQELRRVWAWKTGAHGVSGFGTYGHRDPETGVVYFSYQTAYPNVPPILCGGTATAGNLIWEWPGEFDANDAFIKVFPVGRGQILALTRMRGELHTVRGTVGAPTIEHPSIADGGTVLGGFADNGTSTAVGFGAETRGQRNVAVGVGAEASGTQDTTAVGNNAQASHASATAIGATAQASSSGATAIGYGSNVSGSDATAIGSGASASNGGVAVGARVSGRSSSTLVGFAAEQTSGTAGAGFGNGAKVGNQATALGFLANADSDRGVALGSSSEAGSLSVAVGNRASASQSNSVALGMNTETTLTRQVSIGERHLQILAQSAIPNPPPEGGAHLYTRQNTEGKTVLYVRFATGPLIAIAEEP